MKHFEQPDPLLPNTWVVVRLDGRGFTKYVSPPFAKDRHNSKITNLASHKRFSAKHGFEKPNDKHALALMNAAARGVVTELPDITIAYGVSDEYRYFEPFYLTSLI